jgi:NADPH-dependent F420 reductase
VNIAIMGGTGEEGKGLGYRWAAAGHTVLLGSRLADRGETAAAELNDLLPDGAPRVRGGENLAMAEQADIIVLSVPYAAQQATLARVQPALAGKLLITVVVPLTRPKVSHVWFPPAGSAAQEAQQEVGEDVRVVAAFQNISATLLMDLDHELQCDVLVCGARKADKAMVIELAADAGMVALDAGPLQNAAVVEGLTAVLIGINIRTKIKHSGIRITGLPESQ